VSSLSEAQQFFAKSNLLLVDWQRLGSVQIFSSIEHWLPVLKNSLSEVVNHCINDFPEKKYGA